MSHFFLTVRRDFGDVTERGCRRLIDGHPEEYHGKPFKALRDYLDEINREELLAAADYRELASNG